MLTKYQEFIVEQQISLILESRVEFSNDFKKLIKDIDSPVAKFLLSIENQDYNVPSNFFDIADNKDAITFVVDKKAQQLISDTENKFVKFKGDGHILTHGSANKTIFELLGYEPEGESGTSPSTGQVAEVVSSAVSPVSGKTFLYLKLPNGKCVMNSEYVEPAQNPELWSKNRQSIRIGRGIRALLNSCGAKFTDSELEDFVNKYKSAYDRKNDIFSNFELVTGDEIATYYNHSNYLYGTSRGTLGNSCMATVPSSFFQIYVKNPEVCSLLILRSADQRDKIVGRALIWNLTHPSGVTFMDRVYYTQDSELQLFRDYSKFKGWCYKEHNDSSPTAEVVNPDGTEKDYDYLSVNIKNISYTKYPYVDTLKYLEEFSKYKTLSTNENNSMCLESTGGGYEGGCDECDGRGEITCYRCDGEGEEDCDNCNGKGEVDCEKCDGSGDIDCDDCDGGGQVDGEDCGKCNGTGNKECTRCEGSGSQECEDCRGSGSQRCDRCVGDGVVSCPECG